MRIDTVELKNIGVIPDRRFDLHGNLIAIVGPNGSGKSTLLNAIYAALTNDFSRFGSSKSAAVNNAADGEPAYIRMSGQHQGRPFTLFRSLVPGKNEFVWQDSKTKFTKADDVDAEVRDVLGVSKTILDKYIFVAQGDMFDFLDQTPSVRAKLFQHMCGVEEAAKVHQTCTAFLNRTRVHDVVDNTAQLEADITQANVVMAQHAEKVRQAIGQMLPDAVRAELVRRIEESDAYYKAEAACRNAEQQIATASALADKARVLLADYDSRLANLRANLASMQPRYEQSRAALVAAQQASTAVDRMNMLLRQKTELQTKLSQLVEPDGSVVLDPQVTAEAFGLQGQAQRAIQQYETVSRQTAKSCPTCMQPIQASHVERLRVDAEQASEILAQLGPRLRLSAETQEKLVQYRRDRDMLQQSISHVEQQLATLSAVSTEAAGVDPDVQRFVDEYTRTAHDGQTLQQERANIASSLSGHETGLAVWEAERARLQGTLSGRQPLSTEEMAAAREKIAKADEAKLLYRFHRMAHSDRAVAVGKLWKQRDRVLTEIARAAKRTEILAIAERVSDAFHWDELPRRVTQSNLEFLVTDINANLLDFQAPFTVEVTEDLGFHVHFPDRRPLDAKQLSGGQKVMLALAFRLSLDRIFGGGIGMLFLDEPSAGLDVVNQTIFYETLRNIVARTSEPRQLVVVTHTTGLGKFFDNVVALTHE